MKINDITAAIARSKKEREAAIENGKEAETNWRTRFAACGEPSRRSCARITASALPAASWPTSSPV
ncbi:hypothetical protein AAGR22_19145 [Erwinia sp. HDF1-3R]|uniref:hypothetical protein n=1 Tax=Erwinia sp. HDF1-3R TaxID=3141543 RepID=UPI0031F579C5